MAGSKVDMRQFERAMEKAIKEVESPATMRKIGEEIGERIVKRTRLGKGVTDTGAEASNLKPLAQSTKDQRRGKIGFFTKNGRTIPYTPESPPRLSSLTTPGRSNLTRTGQMLDALKVVAVRVGVVVLGFRGSRTDRPGLTNADVAGYVSKDRPFFKLSRAEMNGLSTLIRERIQEALRKFIA